jgi:hypothetical protein
LRVMGAGRCSRSASAACATASRSGSLFEMVTNCWTASTTCWKETSTGMVANFAETSVEGASGGVNVCCERATLCQLF